MSGTDGANSTGTGAGAPPPNLDISLVTSASLPSSAVIVTLVLAAAVGGERVLRLFSVVGHVEWGVVAFSFLLSIFVTMNAKLSIPWKVVLLPVNFCVLVYLAFSSLALFIAPQGTQSAALQGPPTSTFVVSSQPILGPAP